MPQRDCGSLFAGNEGSSVEKVPLRPKRTRIDAIECFAIRITTSEQFGRQETDCSTKRDHTGSLLTRYEMTS
ncbi:uncharacterized protein LMH87_008394 [Akanthomyces muscarius]|uniref:Uncharacterized protein n=1 Tax=Akanthomyces muscarius TaxID=2231603 RepID=A0A9W8UQU5_AKAMU|nr:uncharacterized protein LMH87_008394 [Akanthomyces muscarius]KAJ4159496.1 hypothetical protein LMH87_008394 [Akanthomyces muscarius]